MNAQTKKQLNKIAKTYKVELFFVEELFERAKEGIVALQGPLHPQKLIRRAVEMVQMKLAEKASAAGKTLNFIPFGMDKPQDQNRVLVENLMKRFTKDPSEIEKLMEEGWLFLYKHSTASPKNQPMRKVFSPISQIKKIERGADKKPLLVQSDVVQWEPGQTPVFRDSRKFRDELGNIKNWNEDEVLGEDWKLGVFGIGFLDESPEIRKKVIMTFYSDLANPKSDRFLGDKIKFFVPSELKVQVREGSCTDSMYVVTGKTDMVTNPSIEIDVLKEVEKFNQEFGKEIIPILDLSDIKKFHLDRRALKEVIKNEETGEEKEVIVKGKGGWDKSNWNEFAVVAPKFMGIAEYKNNFRQMLFLDISVQRNVKATFNPHLNTDLPTPAACLIGIKTSRGTRKYDIENNTTIDNSDDPDVGIEVCGIKITEDYKDMMDFLNSVFTKNVEGDL